MPPVFVYFDFKTTDGLNNVSTTFDALQFEKSSEMCKNWEDIEIVHIGKILISNNSVNTTFNYHFFNFI